MTDAPPDDKKPEETVHVTILSAEALAQALSALREEMRDFTLHQVDLVRTQLELLQTQLDATSGEVAQFRSAFSRLQIEMRREFAELKQSMPSTELMVEIKAVLEARRETRAHLKRGGFWLAFAVAGAVVAEPVKRGLHVAAAKLGLSWFS